MTIQVQLEVILCKEKLDSYQNYERCWCKILLTMSSYFFAVIQLENPLFLDMKKMIDY